MRIIMTGATSFVGAAAAGRLLEDGHTVIAAVRPASGKIHLLTGKHEQALKEKRLLIIENDLETPEGLLKQVPREDGTVFCHFGWGGSGSGAREEKALQEKNLAASLKTAEAAAELGCTRFFFSGSQAEYGMHKELMGEESACRPRSFYGEAKLAMRERGEEVCKKLGMQYIHGRIFSVYGPGDHPWTLVESCLRAFTAGEELSMGKCLQMWNFLYIDDLAKAAAGLCEAEAPAFNEIKNPVFNLAGSETRPLREFVEEIHAACGKRGTPRFGVRPENAEGPVNLIPDIRKLCGFLKWEPEVPFSEGIRRMLSDRTA